MLTHILNLLKGEPADPLPDADARLALGALMVRLAAPAETDLPPDPARIEAFLARLNRLGPADAARMRGNCEKIEAEAPSTRKFAVLIRETVSPEARIEAMEAAWHVVLACGRPGAEDAALLERMRDALGLSKEDGEAAKDRAAPL